MRQVEQLAILVITVVALTAAMILAVGAPSVSVISGIFGAALPVILIYGVIQYSVSSESP